MIKVTLKVDNEDNFKNLIIKGHADPLICAGVSSCFVGAINAIDEIEKFKYQANEGDSYIEVISSINLHDKVVLETLYIQLYTIASKYKNEIKISRERM